MPAEQAPTSAEYRARCLAAIEATARDIREVRALCQELAECQHQMFAKMCVAEAKRAKAGFRFVAHTPAERRHAG